MQILLTDEIVFDLIENLIDLTLPHIFLYSGSIFKNSSRFSRLGPKEKFFDFIKCNMLFMRKFLDIIRAVES